MNVVGGNLDDIEVSAARMVDAGAVARSTGTESMSAAEVLAEAVSDAMRQLLATFERTADNLTTEITRAHGVLVASDWRGQSRENALQIKEQLQGQVGQVLATASSGLEAENAAFIQRARSISDGMERDFNRVMTSVETEYGELAAASRRTRDNLALADQTIGLR